jgi:hypothetical protein
VINGDGMMVNDAVWGLRLHQRRRRPRKLFDGGSSYVLAIAGDAARGTLYVLDAAKAQPLVHVLNADGHEDRQLRLQQQRFAPRARWRCIEVLTCPGARSSRTWFSSASRWRSGRARCWSARAACAIPR